MRNIKKRYYSFARKYPRIHKIFRKIISTFYHKKIEKEKDVGGIPSDFSKQFLKEIKNLKIEKERAKYFSNISIVILNYNNKDIIDNCINSILEHNIFYDCKIVVVDNQSNDGSYEILQSKYRGKITLLRNVKNGCSSGRNLGVSVIDTDFVLFLDSDQWVLHKYWLDAYVKIFQDKSIDAIGWAAGWLGPTGQAYLSVDDMPNRYTPQDNIYRLDIDYIGSGGMMMKVSLFDEIGGFDVNYDPTAYEDTDISFKIKDNGGRIVYSPYLGVGHLPHQTTKDGSIEHTERMMVNGEYFAKKWEKLNPHLFENLVRN